MKLQELIHQTELDMNIPQVKAFLLGVLTADKPLPFSKAIDEMLSETPDAKKILESELKLLWDELQAKKLSELSTLLGNSSSNVESLNVVKDQLDFYLTALSLSGTNTESCLDEDKAEFIDELEEIVMELDDYLADDNRDTDSGEELHHHLTEVWKEYLALFN